MPRTKITPQPAGSGGLAPNFEAANVDGNSYVLRPGRALRVKNGSAAGVNVTVPTPGTVDGLAVAERVVAVAAGADVTIGLGRGDAYRQSDGQAHVDYDAVASVTVAVVDVL
jgi:hypothetical protein